MTTWQIGTKRLEIVSGDLTQEPCDALVTAANALLAGGNQAGFGGGVDGAIHRAAGPTLLDACLALGGCPTGDAVSTPPGLLPVRRVIHAVGPVWGAHAGREEDLLAQTYRRALAEAARWGCRTVAAPAISCGLYHAPLDVAAPLIVRTIVTELERGLEVDRVRLVLFDAATYEHLVHAAERLQSAACGDGS